jgi:hypothetical protein
VTVDFLLKAGIPLDKSGFRQTVHDYIAPNYGSEKIDVRSAITYKSSSGQGIVIIAGTWVGISEDAPSEMIFRQAFGFCGIENLHLQLEKAGFDVEHLTVQVNGRNTASLQRDDPQEDDESTKTNSGFLAVLLLVIAIVTLLVIVIVIARFVFLVTNDDDVPAVAAKDIDSPGPVYQTSNKSDTSHNQATETMDTIDAILHDIEDSCGSGLSVDSSLFPEEAENQNDKVLEHPAADTTLYNETHLNQVVESASDKYMYNANGNRTVTSFLYDPNRLGWNVE